MKDKGGAKHIKEIDCEEAIKRLNDYIDNYLQHNRKDELEKHLASCIGCTQRFEFQQSLKTKITAISGQCDPSLATKLKDLLASLP